MAEARFREPVIWALFVLLALGGGWALWGESLSNWLGRGGPRTRDDAEVPTGPATDPATPPNLL